MLKKTITYTDFNGQERKDDFYFHMSKAELVEMSVSETGGLEVFIRKIIATDNYKEMVRLMKEVILKAYGEKSDDGKSFVKTPEKTAAFAQSEAYSILFMELFDSKKFADFVNALIPANMREELEKKLKDAQAKKTSQSTNSN